MICHLFFVPEQLKHWTKDSESALLQSLGQPRGTGGSRSSTKTTTCTKAGMGTLSHHEDHIGTNTLILLDRLFA